MLKSTEEELGEAKEKSSGLNERKIELFNFYNYLSSKKVKNQTEMDPIKLNQLFDKILGNSEAILNKNLSNSSSNMKIGVMTFNTKFNKAAHDKREDQQLQLTNNRMELTEDSFRRNRSSKTASKGRGIVYKERKSLDKDHVTAAPLIKKDFKTSPKRKKSSKALQTNTNYKDNNKHEQQRAEKQLDNEKNVNNTSNCKIEKPEKKRMYNFYNTHANCIDIKFGNNLFISSQTVDNFTKPNSLTKLNNILAMNPEGDGIMNAKKSTGKTLEGFESGEKTAKLGNSYRQNSYTLDVDINDTSNIYNNNTNFLLNSNRNQDKGLSLVAKLTNLEQDYSVDKAIQLTSNTFKLYHKRISSNDDKKNPINSMNVHEANNEAEANNEGTNTVNGKDKIPSDKKIRFNKPIFNEMNCKNNELDKSGGKGPSHNFHSHIVKELIASCEKSKADDVQQIYSMPQQTNNQKYGEDEEILGDADLVLSEEDKF